MHESMNVNRQNYYGAFQHKNATVEEIISALPCYLRSSVAVEQFINLLNK
jgi:hypothetical protein